MINHHDTGKPEIFAAILESSIDGINAQFFLKIFDNTSSLSAAEIEQYLKTLESDGLLLKLSDGKHAAYKTTRKGIKYLQFCQPMYSKNRVSASSAVVEA